MNRNLMGAALILSLSLAACSATLPPTPATDASSELVTLQGQALPAGPASSQANLSLSSQVSALSLTAGTPTSFTVNVKSNNVTGPIKLHLSSLPINVTAPDVTLLAGTKSAVLTLTQTGKSPARTTTLQVQASASTVSASLGLALTVLASDAGEPAQAAPDAPGNTPGGDFVAPTTLKFTPTDGTVGISHDAFKTTVTFSEAMNRAATQQAFQMIVPNFNASKQSFNWNAAGTVMTMTYSGAVPYGSTVFWGMSSTAADLAGNNLINASSIGGTFRIVRQKTVKLLSDAGKDLDSMYLPTDHAFSSVNGFGDTEGNIGQIAHSPTYTDRAFIQFPLKNLSDLGVMTKLNSAKLGIVTIAADNHPEDLGGVMLDQLSTPLYWQESSLWFAPIINASQINHILPDALHPGVHEFDITAAFASNIKNPAQFYGLSQWRIKMEHDETSQSMSKVLRLGLGGNADLNKRPYIQVTYEYP
ncbi:Ig-like domain-containing protein [Deinococcus alpinitundrae]|uniref:Ig-like domain-containing protein n=1 Tax=Deinococcus alpinitundrae TaxID=468913 RepID=UPI00137B1B3C|nr:Ig-like domain-containing protein [Deinococcus alpinitundrae]